MDFLLSHSLSSTSVPTFIKYYDKNMRWQKVHNKSYLWENFLNISQSNVTENTRSVEVTFSKVRTMYYISCILHLLCVNYFLSQAGCSVFTSFSNLAHLVGWPFFLVSTWEIAIGFVGIEAYPLACCFGALCWLMMVKKTLNINLHHSHHEWRQ